MTEHPSTASFTRSSLHGERLLAAAVLAALAVPAAAQAPQLLAELSRRPLPARVDATRAVAVGDVDGDGDQDIVLGNQGQDRLYLNDGEGSFQDATWSRMPLASDPTSSVVLGDLDGDGDLDIVFGNQGQDRVLRNDGTGTFADVTSSHIPVNDDPTEALARGDVDADGDLDLVVGSGQDWGGPPWLLPDRLLLNDGSGVFSDVTATHMPTHAIATQAVVLGDIDGDGDLDLISGGFASIGYHGAYAARTRLHLNDGSGVFTEVTATHMPSRTDLTTSLALADVDADGDPDLFVGTGNTNGSGSQNRLFLNDGTGVFTDVWFEIPGSADATNAVVMVDLDRDGDLDAIFVNSGQNRALLNVGAAYGVVDFRDASGGMLPIEGDDSRAVGLGDIDGDGDLDMLIGQSSGWGGHPDRLLFNLQRQLHANHAPRIGLPYALDAHLRYRPPGAANVAAIFLSTGRASIPLPGLGTLRIDPAQAAPLPLLTIPFGMGTASLTVPNDLGLVGLQIHCQALIGTYPGDLRLSNVVSDVVGQ